VEAIADGPFPAGGNFDGFCRDRGGCAPELATQPIAAEAGATRQGNMEPGTPPMAYHCVCEDARPPKRQAKGVKLTRPPRQALAEAARDIFFARGSELFTYLRSSPSPLLRSSGGGEEMMRVEPPYNPLDKKNLGVSVADALLVRRVEPLQLSDGAALKEMGDGKKAT